MSVYRTDETFCVAELLGQGYKSVENWLIVAVLIPKVQKEDKVKHIRKQLLGDL